MTDLYHCTGVYEAVSIFETGVFKTSTSPGDECINLHLLVGNKRTEQQAENTGCFINFKWKSPSISKGGPVDLKDIALNHLYIERWNDDKESRVWRVRLREPYYGQSLIMTKIEFDEDSLRKKLIKEYKKVNQPLVSKLIYKLFYKEKKEVLLANNDLKKIKKINLLLISNNGKPIHVEIDKRYFGRDK